MVSVIKILEANKSLCFRPKWTVWYSRQAHNNLDICIFEFESMLLFTNAERFAVLFHLQAIRTSISGGRSRDS